MEFLGNLGIDIKLLIAQMINFGLLLIILKKFLYKPIIDRIEKDEKELKQVKTQKIKLGEEKELFAKEKKEKIIETKNQAKKIIKEAEDIASELKKRSSEETQNEKNAIIKQIKSRLAKIENEK